MDSRKIGQFIAEQRKAKQMTQKDLALQLNITDKAVSKWERGLSCPDITILSSVAEILGVTVSELLEGEKSEGRAEILEKSVGNALQYADNTVKSRVKSLQKLWLIVFTALLAAAIVVCAICDMALSGTLTWSLYPISSMVFAWFVISPLLGFGKKGLRGSLILLCVLILPFLLVLNILTGHQYPIMPVGIRVSFLAGAYLWIVYGWFKKMGERKMLAGAASLFAAIGLDILIRLSLSNITGEPVIDVWNMMSALILAAAGGVLFFVHTRKIQKERLRSGES